MDISPNVFFHDGMPGAYEATYYPTNGDPIQTVVLLDSGVVRFPGGLDSDVMMPQTEITLRYDHVPNPKRGDRITVGTDAYVVEAELLNDQFEVRVTVRNYD